MALQRRLTLQADIRAALRPEHLAGTGYDRRLADHGERFDIRGALDRRILAGRSLRSVDTEHRAVGRAVAVDDTVMRHRDTATRPQLHLRRIGGRIHGFHIIGGPDPHIARLDVDERRGVASDDGPRIRFDGGVAVFADGGGLDAAGLRTFGDHGGASCWATSNRAAVEATPASASRLRTLKRAALRSLSEVTHTVPSSSCT